MRKLTMAACLTAMAGSGAAAPPTGFNTPQDVAAIRAIEEALATETDMSRIIGYYAPDAMVMDIYAPGIFKGRDQIVAGFAPQLAMVGTMRHRFPEIEIAAHGDFACAATQIHFDTTMKDGTPLKLTIRQLDAYRRMGGKWQLIQQHVSLPVDAKTGTAVLDGAVRERGPMAWSADPLPGPATGPGQAKREIRTWMDVGTLSTTLTQLMQYYGPGDDTLVYDTFYPGELRGRKEISDYYAPIMSSYNSVKVQVPEFVADSDGLFGVQADTQDMQLAMNDGSTKYISLRQSDCMRRVNGKWYSFFEMISFPIDPKSNKAIMEKPAAFK